jgi:hypothetical protein
MPRKLKNRIEALILAWVAIFLLMLLPGGR